MGQQYLEVLQEYLKPGREAYTIENPAFVEGIKIISEVLNHNNIPYALYGGTALQLLFYREIRDEKTLSKILRATSDFDIAVQENNLKDIYNLLMEKQEFYIEEDNYVFEGFIETRNSVKRMILNVYGINNTTEYNASIMVTFISDNEFGEEMINSRELYKENIKSINIETYISPIEYSLVGKIRRLNPHRDVPDLYNALSLLKVDFNKLRELSKELGRRSRDYTSISIILNNMRNEKSFLNYLNNIYKAVQGKAK